MKKLFLIVALIFIKLSVSGQDITGQWNGLLNVGVQLRVVFHISKTEDGYTATMDSPDQGAKGIPVTSTTFNNPNLVLEVSNMGIRYEGAFEKEDFFVGNFKQAGQSFPLDLARKMSEKKEVLRPQEPTLPYSYYSEDITFENSKDTIVLAGTLTMPEKEGNFPAVVLISGSGPQNRDEELMGHKPFLVLADHLTKNGLAVLRFDDRGTAESTGDFSTAISQDFATDVEFAVQYLLSRKEINSKQIGLIGHSEGGMIAPLVAADSKDVSYVVLLAGPGIRGGQILLQQQYLIGKASGAREEDLERSREVSEDIFNMIQESENVESVQTALTNYLLQVVKNLPDDKKPKGISDEDFVKSRLSSVTNPWMYNFLKYDPAPILESVQCPVLALNGEKDLQVPPAENLEAIAKALARGGNKNVTTKELAGLNHLFQECTTGSPAEYGTIEQTFSQVALEEITQWILGLIK